MTATVVASSAGKWHGGPERDRRMAAAHTVLGNCGVVMSPAKVRRMVQNYERRAQRYGADFDDYLDQVAVSELQRQLVGDELRRVTAYADKTGERAVSNVLKSQGRRR